MEDGRTPIAPPMKKVRKSVERDEDGRITLVEETVIGQTASCERWPTSGSEIS